MKKVLFIDRDGTVIQEPPVDFQVDSLEKLVFQPYAVSSLAAIRGLDYELAMVTNQDGMGTPLFPAEDFWKPQRKMAELLAGEGVRFDEVFIDPSLPEENSPNRKPGTGMLGKYLSGGEYDLPGSLVIGDRLTDVQLAKNLGAKAILFRPFAEGTAMLREAGLEEQVVLVTDDWRKIYECLRLGDRRAEVSRKTRETDIRLRLDLDGQGESRVDTGLRFFDHMLEQVVCHAGFAMELAVEGDLDVDEHHTVEDVGIVLGEAVGEALGAKRGIARYGFALPMDESEALVLLDFGGRIDFRWTAEFRRERIGDVPTELFEHFFRSFCHGARCNLHIEARGTNEHHKIEGIFKAFARTLRAAVRRDVFNAALPSSKGLL